MQIVIKISDEKYNAIKSKYNTFPAEMKEWGLEAIRNGMLLPKNCRLINVNILPNEVQSLYSIRLAQTIIEADGR